MRLIIFLLANGIFLAALLLVLLALVVKNGNTKISGKKVLEDIKKIKKQIIGDPE